MPGIRDLSDPARLIPHLQVKVQSFTKDKRKALMVSYIDARDAAQILDDVLGPEAWSSTLTSPPVVVADGWAAQVRITVTTPSGEVFREDFGSGSGNLDMGAKGAASDALKRAAVQLGVGRALYSLSAQYAPTHEWSQGKFDVQDAEKRKVRAKWEGELRRLADAWRMGDPLPPAPVDEGGDPSENGAAAAAPDDVVVRRFKHLRAFGQSDEQIVAKLRSMNVQSSAELADDATWAKVLTAFEGDGAGNGATVTPAPAPASPSLGGDL